MLGCRIDADYTDRRHFQVLVRGGHYFFETRVFRRDGAHALRLPGIGKGFRKLYST
jgi:hypothetical protein